MGQELADLAKGKSNRRPYHVPIALMDLPRYSHTKSINRVALPTFKERFIHGVSSFN